MGKEAGVIGKVISAPFRGLARAGYRASVRDSGKVLGPLMFAGGVLGIAGAAKSAVGKARQFNRGFDPRIQNAAMQRVK